MNLTLKTLPQGGPEFEAFLQAKRIYCVASGEVADVMKYYFYAQAEVSKAEFYVEVVVTKKTKTLDAIIKCTKNSEIGQFKAMFADSLKTYL